MKSFFFCIFTLFLFLNFTKAQTDTLSSNGVERDKIRELNLKLVSLYKEKKIDEALTVGKTILETAQKSDLLNDSIAITAINNLGELYLAKEKVSEAINVFKIVANSYEKNGNKSALEKTLNIIVSLYLGKKDFKNAEPFYVKLVELTENSKDAKSRKAANLNLQLADVYNSLKKPEKAELYYLKAIEINDQVLSQKEQDERTDIDIYKCFCYHKYFQKGKISDAAKALEELDKKRRISPDDNLKLGIINGKAIDLVKPKYPEKAKEMRASGFAIVSVEIDEQGNVVKAKATCGFLEFVKEVEAAAMKSKFTPTLKNGVAVKVTGDIVYNFTATVR